MYSRSIERRRADDARAARQSERDAIARELHDLAGHTLAPPDPPVVASGVARIGIVALWLALALLLFEWVSYHRMWTT